MVQVQQSCHSYLELMGIHWTARRKQVDNQVNSANAQVMRQICSGAASLLSCSPSRERGLAKNVSPVNALVRIKKLVSVVYAPSAPLRGQDIYPHILMVC